MVQKAEKSVWIEGTIMVDSAHQYRRTRGMASGVPECFASNQGRCHPIMSGVSPMPNLVVRLPCVYQKELQAAFTAN